MAHPHGEPVAWTAWSAGLGWIVAVICLVLAIVMYFMGHMDLPVTVLIAAVASHRL